MEPPAFSECDGGEPAAFSACNRAEPPACSDAAEDPADPSGSTPVQATEQSPPGPRSLNAKIQELKELQAKAMAEKRRLAKELRNEERKRKRLKERAKQLTDVDLLQVLRLREEARQASSSSTTTPPALEAKAKSKAGASRPVS